MSLETWIEMSRWQYIEIQQLHSYFSYKTKLTCYQTFKEGSKQIWWFNFSGNEIPIVNVFREKIAGRFRYQIVKQEGDFFYL
jgi:hypothetical protein